MSQLTISLFDIPQKTGATGSVGVGAVPLLPLSIIDHVPVLAPPATAGHIRHLGHGGHQLSDMQGASILTIFVNKTQYSFLSLLFSVRVRNILNIYRCYFLKVYSDLIFIGRQYEFKIIAKMFESNIRHDKHVRSRVLI